MNTLKFRVWDKETGKRCDWTNANSFFDLDNKGIISWFRNDERFIIEQFTGVLDSDKKEIYEGDIIRDKWKESLRFGFQPSIAYDRENVFVVKYIAPSFTLDSPYQDGQTYIDDFQRKVIGNIFEHPYLLKNNEDSRK